MRRPRPREEGDSFCVLIPARDEAENLKRLLPSLLAPNPGLRAYVFDDESIDGTAEIAAALGAIVIRPAGPLPAGWAGKNRACHELAKVAMEDSDADWYLFLDADVRLEPDFIAMMRGLAHVCPRAGVLTGFPRIISGRGAEPLVLGWVGWILLVIKSYGLVSRTGLGHGRFTNGQIHAWRPSVYADLWPNERLKGALLEDVKIGRLLADEKVNVEVANLSKSLAVKMYDTWREALDGMSKNSYEICDSPLGTILLGAVLIFIAWGWTLAGALWPWALGLFLLSGVGAMAVVRARFYFLPFLPLAVMIGGLTLWRSAVWRKRGVVRWKGRVYPS